MQKLLYFLSLFFSLLFFVSCGSEAKSSAAAAATYPVNLTIKGIVADAYISGATVCLDSNFNNVCDATEQTVLSSSTGNFAFNTVTLQSDDFLPIVVYGGKDVATGKDLKGHLRAIVNAQTYSPTTGAYVSPITDLVAIAFLGVVDGDVASLQSAISAIAYGYRISTSLINKNPMKDATVFAVSQDIQQTKALIEAAALNAYGSSLTTVQLKQLRSDIKTAIVNQISRDGTFDITAVIALFKTLTGITIDTTMQTYLKAQLNEINLAIYEFADIQGLTLKNLYDFQNALENETDSIVSIIEKYPANLPLKAFPIVIDVFSTDTNDTNTTPPVEDGTYTLAGTMVDGYISGATVCIDSNFDGLCGTTESRTTTLADGSYLFESVLLTQDTLISLLGYGGTNTATSKLFSGVFQTILPVSATTQISDIVLSPLNDVATFVFLAASEQTANAWNTAKDDTAAAFGISTASLGIDPMQEKVAFLRALGVEQLRIFLETSIAKTKSTTLSALQKKKIKEALYEQILQSGYASLDFTRVLTSIEVKLGFVFTGTYKTFAVAQMDEIVVKLANLDAASSLEATSLPRVEQLLNAGVSEAVSAMQYKEIDLSVETVMYSMFDKTGAEYDTQSCWKNGTYDKQLTSLNTTATPSKDSTNGLSLGFSSIDLNQTRTAALFYPSLGGIALRDELVFFQDDYFFSYDKAWISTGKSIYLQSPMREDGLYECRRIKLDQNFAINLEPVKVYRYTDVP